MKKLDLKLSGTKNVLSREQMKKITGGYFCDPQPYYYVCTGGDCFYQPGGVCISCYDMGLDCWIHPN